MLLDPEIHDVALFRKHERGDGLCSRYVREKGVSGKRQMNRASVVGNVDVVAVDPEIKHGIDQYRTTHLHPSRWCRANKRATWEISLRTAQSATSVSARSGRIALVSSRFAQETTPSPRLPFPVLA